MLDFQSFLQEGLQDPATFKAIMMAGGAGSGKSRMVSDTAVQAFGMRLSNSDPAFEQGLKKAGLKLNSKDIMSAQGQAIRMTAKKLTDKQKSTWLEGRLGIVVDGTGKDLDDVKNEVRLMMDMGYDVGMIFVNTELETSIERDKNRSRTLGRDMVTKTWKDVQKNRDTFKRMFGAQFVEIDNSIDPNSPNGFKDLSKETLAAFKKFRSWINKEPTNPIYKKWVKSEMDKNNIKSYKRPKV